MRRQGTGRVTTKRTFSLNVFKGSQLGQFGRKTGLPLKQGVKRDAYGLDDVDNFWRDSLEGAPSDQQAEGAGEGGGGEGDGDGGGGEGAGEGGGDDGGGEGEGGGGEGEGERGGKVGGMLGGTGGRAGGPRGA